MKYIVVTGGVISGLGKGITISSIGRILKASGVRVTAIKIDPYLNVDAGTMSPFEHGETFVLDDGGETDLDLGNYERFLDINLSNRHNITTGKIYSEVIQQERNGDYLGKTVQIVPHATDLIQSWIKVVSKIPVDGTGVEPEVCLVEVGGTVGDIESMVFLEALRQFQFTVGRDNIVFVHVSLLPVTGSEQKTKPTQHSVKELRSLGLSPDFIVCRSSRIVEDTTKAKISAFCHVPPSHVLSVHDVTNIYHVPLILVAQGIHGLLKTRLHLRDMDSNPELVHWKSMAEQEDDHSNPTKIAIVGKYTQNQDSYLSVSLSLRHAALHLKTHVDISWVEASDLEEEMKSSNVEKYHESWDAVRGAQGILIPGGFGVRGIEGMISAAKYARENKVPYLGVCLGMQVLVMEYARSILGLKGANSTEFNETTPYPVVIFMPEISKKVMGGTMRLGERETVINYHLKRTATAKSNEETPRSLASEIYDTSDETEAVKERHRHRYEVNPKFVDALTEAGLNFTGKDITGEERMEIVELSKSSHPFYFGAQFHPEFKSRPNRPSPPFFAFLATAKTTKEIAIGDAGRMWQDYEDRILSAFVANSPIKRAGRALSNASMSDGPEFKMRRSDST